MHICQTGEISDNFYVLGHSAVPIYLLDGPEPLLFDAGFSGLSYLYVKEIRAVLGNRSPAFLFLTHAHWDHVGAAAYFKELWPHMKIAGSLKSSQILARKGALAQIKTLNQKGLEALRSWGVNHIFEGEFKPFTFDIVLKDGQKMNIWKGLTVTVIAAPGHTWDSTAYYLEGRKILISGEAAGCDGVCDFLVDHEAYAASLKQLAGLNAEILCTAHKDIFTGKDVPKNMIKYMHMLKEYVARVKRYLEEEQGDIDRTVARIRTAEWDPKPLPKQPLEPYLINTGMRVKTILKHMYMET
ncbi:MAG: MBL fold metallo-hydrolase [Deltaproteobacteria bacterium]|nr:MBL fold metallo-hydrolase [Deltaproteobacteria bacterium]